MKTLYIIGNGFDLAHNLHSSYGDFHTWLHENKQDYFIECMEMFFSHWDIDANADLLWYDFEKALGDCDFEEAYEIFAKQSREFYGSGTEYLRDLGNTSEDNFSNPLMYDMPMLFSLWIQLVNEKIVNIPKENLVLKNIEAEDLFLTFNYTDTLELLYGIPSVNICHIHNSVSAGEQPIVGHNITYTIKVPYEMSKGESDLKQSLADVLNSLKKDYKGNVKKNITFFNQLDDTVGTICFYGHSLGDIDLPYFREVKKRVSSNVKWIFYIYSGENDEQLRKNKTAVIDFINRMHLDKHMCKAFDSINMNQEIHL